MIVCCGYIASIPDRLLWILHLFFKRPLNGRVLCTRSNSMCIPHFCVRNTANVDDVYLTSVYL